MTALHGWENVSKNTLRDIVLPDSNSTLARLGSSNKPRPPGKGSPLVLQIKCLFVTVCPSCIVYGGGVHSAALQYVWWGLFYCCCLIVIWS